MFPQTRMIQNVFDQLFHVYVLEVYQGMYDDVPRQSLETLKDRNFQHFLSATMKLLLFIGDNDRYYRAWIGLAFKVAKEEYDRAARELTQDEFRRSYLEQWELSFPAVSPGHFESQKSEFLDMILASYLPNLMRMEIDKARSPAKQETKR